MGQIEKNNKMKNYLTLIIFFVVLISANAQEVNLLQGIWENLQNGESSEKNYSITKGKTSLSFTYTESSFQMDFPLWESVDGFLDVNPIDKGIVNINDLKNSGEYFITAERKRVNKEGVVRYPDFLVPDYFDCDGQNLSIGGNNIEEYIKIERLPSFALKLLYNRGKKDDINYIEDYLGIEAQEVKVEKSVIYSEPDNSTKMFFIKGDVVTVLDKKEGWLRIEFLGTRLVQGWIKAEDVK